MKNLKMLFLLLASALVLVGCKNQMDLPVENQEVNTFSVDVEAGQRANYEARLNKLIETNKDVSVTLQSRGNSLEFIGTQKCLDKLIELAEVQELEASGSRFFKSKKYHLKMTVVVSRKTFSGIKKVGTYTYIKNFRTRTGGFGAWLKLVSATASLSNKYGQANGSYRRNYGNGGWFNKNGIKVATPAPTYPYRKK